MDFDNALAKFIRTGNLNGIRSLRLDSSTVNYTMVCQTPIPQHYRKFALPNIRFPTPLVYSILCQQPDVTYELLACGADPNVFVDDWLPIHYAVAIRSPKIVTHIIEADEEQINAKTKSMKNSPLHMAVSADSPEIVSLLLKYGADPNITNGKKNTPLHMSLYAHDKIIIEALLAFGCDPNAVNESEETAAKLAENRGMSEIAQFITDISENKVQIRSKKEILDKTTPLDPDEQDAEKKSFNNQLNKFNEELA